METVQAFALGVRSFDHHWKRQCHVVEILRRKTFDCMVHPGDIDTHALGGAQSQLYLGPMRISVATAITSARA